mgnify:CR=1 FL=1|tara:strand:+ start:4299 stop:5546 length:1248 start_codon:yes stop_codon:yes gene_type:complete
MAKNKIDYTVYSSNLDVFLKIRNLSDNEMDDFVDDVGDLIYSGRKNIRDYIVYVVNTFVHNVERYAEDDFEESYDSMFEAVLEAYPVLQIDTICELLNTKVSLEKQTLEDLAYKKSIAESKDSLKSLKTLSRSLRKEVVGQDDAIDEVIDCLKLRAAGFSSFSSFFFIGPTGVGKTELARALSRRYLKSSRRLLKINCGEYSNPHEYAKLIGSPPGYIGFNEKGILSEKAQESSEWIILFDEIEKASGKLHNLLLGFLDDGVIQDNHGTELNFKDSIVIFTSNVGMENLGRTPLGFETEQLSYKEVKSDVEKSFKGKFPPEFINRIDHVVHFNQLSKEDTAQIAKLNLKDLPIKQTKKLVDYIVDGGYSTDYGARNLKRFIRKNVTLKLADAILEGPKCNKYTPTFKGGELYVSG